jgi:hypothetical protein
MKESRLKTIGLFAGLSRGEIRRLSNVTDEVVVPAGTRLIDEGTFAHEFLLIEAGTADVRRAGELLSNWVRATSQERSGSCRTHVATPPSRPPPS